MDLCKGKDRLRVPAGAAQDERQFTSFDESARSRETASRPSLLWIDIPETHRRLWPDIDTVIDSLRVS